MSTIEEEVKVSKTTSESNELNEDTSNSIVDNKNDKSNHIHLHNQQNSNTHTNGTEEESNDNKEAGKLSSLTDELRMPVAMPVSMPVQMPVSLPVATTNVTMSGDIPPLPLMSQMNMSSPRAHTCGPQPQSQPHATHTLNMASPHMLHPNTHPNAHNMYHLGPNNNNNNNNITAHNKASLTMDSQYMQQQSQIFVFNTQMANQAADAVDNGLYPSIIDFHCSNPRTKEFLKNHPSKVQAFNRMNTWNSMTHMKQMGGGRGIKANMINANVMHHSMLNNPYGQPPPQPPQAPQPQQPRPGLPVVGCAGACNHNHNVHNSPQGMPQGPGPGGGTPWNANQNMCSNWSPQQHQQQHQQQPQHQQLFAQNSNINVTSIGSETRGCNTSSNSLMPCNNSFAANNNNNINFQSNPQLFPNSSICNAGQPMPSQLAGPEIPDENLTPQQRQHREKKLSILRIMQQQLCPEMMEPSSMGQLNNMMRMPLPHQNMESCIHNVLDPLMCTNMCQLSENEQHVHNNDNAMNSLLTPSTVVSNNSNTNSLQYSQSSQTSMPPTPASAQIEWQKLQTNYLEERRRKLPPTGSGGQVQSSNMCSATNTVPISHHSQSPLSQSSSTMNSPSPCISASPGSRIPPPPYNQGIRPLSSPHPSSPATGSLPLPSPRMQSPADASRQQFTTSAQNRVPHASPGPATPSADSNSSLLGSAVHSPKSLPSSSTQSSLPSATSSSIVPNSCVNQRTTSTSVTSINNVTTTSIAPISSPSTGKKLNLVSQSAPKALSQECSDMIANNSSNNKLHQSSDISLIGAPNCSSPFICKPEPALMPVPSPQQIQYLNAFEGQELTIQKQPNTSLRETDLISPPPGIDLGFSNEFGANSCQPFQGIERMPNFNINDNINRFSLNHQAMNMSGPQFDLHPRFMLSDGNNQRFIGANFDGPSRMPNSHDPHFRSQNMVCMPYGNQMENNVMRFPNSSDLIGGPNGQRIRGPQPMDMAMNVRFNAHLNENIQSPLHFNATMSPLSNEQINMMSFANSNQSQAPSCMAPVNNFNSPLETGISSTHLQNLQKMTPPFDIGPANKVDGMMQMPNGSMAHSHNNNSQTMHNSNGPLVSQSQRSANFDPISSMAAMGESNSGSQMNAQQNLMNMTNMQVGSNGPSMPSNMPSNLVNFHTSMSSMQGIHQNMSPDANGLNGGMQNHYNMSQQMAHNMTGGPQTVNNTYVNANLSIQQLNIQNAPNFNPNMNQPLNNQNNMNITPPIGGGVTGLSPPSGAMQMMQQNSSSKLGSGFAHRMPGSTPSGTFTGQQMNNPRGMSPLNYPPNHPPNPHMMTRCEYNSANIQVKPNAPNTIQYLPARPQSQNHSNSANIRPSFDFLQRFEPPLTNLGNKLPTHNLQYFPSNNGNMNNSQPPPGMSLPPRLVSQNIPLASGPGRPINTQLVRAPNSNSNINSGQQNLIGSGDMFIRVGGPNNMMNGPHIGGPAAPNNMFTNMKSGNNVNTEPICGSPVPPVHVMAHDASQPLPPSVGHSVGHTVGHTYNYKQTPFSGIGPMTSDPNYAVQFHNFQQQLYATNTRTSNNTANSNSGSNNSRIPSNNFYSSAK